MGIIFLLIVGIIIIYVTFFAGKGILWFLSKTRIVYPLVWFIFTLIFVDKKEEWPLYDILLCSPYLLYGYVWSGIGILITFFSLESFIKDIIRTFIPDFCWGNIPRFFRRKKLRKEIAQEKLELEQLEKSLYCIYPELEKEEFYFINEVCQNEYEKEEFWQDWRNYLIELKNDGEVSQIEKFSSWYNNNKRWKYTSYNHEYMKQYKSQREEIYKNSN